MKKNIFYDTNSIYKLFDYKNEKKEDINIKMCELEKVAKCNNGYVTSIVLDEIKFRCHELNKDFCCYMNFLNELFPNKGSWYIKDSTGDITDFKQRKSAVESDYLFRIISILIASTLNAYEDFLGRKLDSRLYDLIIKFIIQDTRKNIDNIIQNRYIGTEIKNRDVNKAVNEYLYNALHKGLKFLSMNYPFPKKEIDRWSKEEAEKFHEICSREIKYDVNEYLKYCFRYQELMETTEDEQIMNKFILYNMIEDKKANNSTTFSDIKHFWDKIKKSMTVKLDDEEAVFLYVSDSPDLKYIEIKETQDKEKLEGKGRDYLNWIVSKIKSNFIDGIINNFDSTIDFMDKKGVKYLEIEKKYLKYLIDKILRESRSIEKNDVNDFLIVTAPSHLELEDSVIISFDKNVRRFIEDNNVFYDKEIYGSICNKNL